MKEILENLFEYNKLDYNQAKRVLIEIASNKYSNTEIASFITAFKMRNPSIEEMEGFRDALLELCVKIDFNEFNTIDLCGTGGDGKDTFKTGCPSDSVPCTVGSPAAVCSSSGTAKSWASISTECICT